MATFTRAGTGPGHGRPHILQNMSPVWPMIRMARSSPHGQVCWCTRNMAAIVGGHGMQKFSCDVVTRQIDFGVGCGVVWGACRERGHRRQRATCSGSSGAWQVAQNNGYGSTPGVKMSVASVLSKWPCCIVNWIYSTRRGPHHPPAHPGSPTHPHKLSDPCPLRTHMRITQGKRSREQVAARDYHAIIVEDLICLIRSMQSR